MLSPQPQDENVNPDTGQNALTESKSQKCKWELKETRVVCFLATSVYCLNLQLFQALNKVQQSEAQQRKTIHEQTLLIEKLKACAHTSDSHHDDSSDSDDQGQSKKKKKTSHKTSNKLLRKDALQAGKRFAVETALWTEPGAIRYVALLKDGKPDGNLSDEPEDDDEVKEQAALIYESLPAHLRPHVDGFRSV